MMSLLAGCVYDSYLPRIKQARNYQVPAPKRVTTGESLVIPANFSPKYDDLSYHFVTVQPGDTVSRVAARNNVPLKSVLSLNYMQAPYTIHPGQQLKIPAFRKHKVQPGETLYAISRVYDVEIAEVALFNGLSSPYTLMPGSEVQIPLHNREEIRIASAQTTRWLPANTPVSQSQVPVKTIVVNSLPQVVELPKSEVAATAARNQIQPAVVTTAPAENTAPAPKEPSVQVAKFEVPPVPRRRYSIKEPPARSGQAFSWPVKGRVISGYGKKSSGYHNDGVNILVKKGTPIRAAENGVVSYVGNEMRSFGNLLLVSHSDGYVTAYGHTDKAAVSKGDAVKKGDIIAYAGDSGNVDKSQLHFEIRKKGKALDPVPLLK